MASTSPLLLRLVASSVCVSKRAGTVIQNVLRSGKLNIVEKVFNLIIYYNIIF